MNPAEQRQRSTAVQTVERRVDDIETVVKALAGEMVKDRDGTAKDRVAILEHWEHCWTITERLNREIHVRLARLEARVLCRSTLWTRLRWLLLGS